MSCVGACVHVRNAMHKRLSDEVSERSLPCGEATCDALLTAKVGGLPVVREERHIVHRTSYIGVLSPIEWPQMSGLRSTLMRWEINDFSNI